MTCECCCSLCEVSCAEVLLCLEDSIFLESSIPLDSYNRLSSFSTEFPEPFVKGIDEDISVRTDGPVSHSLHSWPVISFLISSHLLQEEASLAIAEQNTDLCV